MTIRSKDTRKPLNHCILTLRKGVRVFMYVCLYVYTDACVCVADG